jgi:hypothetical protein
VTALQVLPARQRAVLILRDVLGYHANEVSDMLGSTVGSVNSTLKRARATLRRRLPATGERQPPPAPDSPQERALVAKLVRAYDSGLIDALVVLLTDDVSVSMPPIPFEYHGRDAASRFLAVVSRQGRRYDLVPTRAKGSWRSGSTFGPRPATACATGPASTSSPSQATGSALSPASTPACSRHSGCLDRFLVEGHGQAALAGDLSRDLHDRSSSRTSRQRPRQDSNLRRTV